MRGVLAKTRRSNKVLRLLGATALTCVLAGMIPAQPAFAQSLGDGAAASANEDLLLEADTIVYDNDRNTITAVGGVQIDYDGNRLVAQRVTYDRATSRLIASGNVEIVDPDGNRYYSDEIDVTDDFRDAFVRTLRVQTADNTYFAAENAERADGTLTTFTRGVYTACEPCEDKPDKAPIWRIKAQKIIWNGQAKTVRFERARFEFFGLPLAFLPAWEIADPTVKQKSGFLIPSYGYSSETGHRVTVPYYWALSPTYDITFKPAWYSQQGFLGEAEWRQQFDNGSYSITIAGMSQNNPWGTGGDAEKTRAMIGSRGSFQINPRWTFGWDVMAQTDKNFSYRYGIGDYGALNREDKVYLTGLDDRNFFDLRFQRFTVQERVAVGSSELQPWVLPSFDYSYTPDESVAGGELNIDINAQGIYRSRLDQICTGVNTSGSIVRVDCAAPAFPILQSRVRGIEGTSGRVTAEAEWKRSVIAPGGLLLTPILHARGDVIGVDYAAGSQAAIAQVASLNSVGTDIRSSYYRAMATGGLEARWPILFSTSSSTHVLEPMGQLFARPDAPYGSTLGIPNEDAQSLVFDATNLFERDKFSGYDRIEGGVRANLGIRYSGAFGNGWSTRALFGQSFHLAGTNPYTSPDLLHVGAFSGLESARSDYVASAGLISPLGISLSAGGRFDEQTFDVRRVDLTAGYSSRPVSVSASYSFIEKQPDYGFASDRHEVRGSASLRFGENWRAFASGTYDITKAVVASKSIGFAYDDECFSYTMAATETINVNDTSRKTQNIGFTISLRTLGEFQADVDPSDLSPY